MLKHLFFFLLLQPFFAAAQPVYFEKKFGSGGPDAGRSLKQLSNGDIFVVGYSDTAVGGKNDYALSKLDKTGKLIWTKYYGDSLNNIALGITIDKNESLILCGQTEVNTGNQDAFVSKIDTSGTVIWQKTFGNAQNQSLKYITSTADNGYVACGFTSDNSGSNDFYILKLDSLGNQQWLANYGGSFNDYAQMILPTKEGGYLVTGDTNSDGSGGYDVEIIQLDSSGSVIWDKLYGDSLQNGCQGILALKHGGFLSYGETEINPGGAYDFFIQKIDSVGNSIYRKTFGGIKSDAIFSMLEATDGGLVFTGYSNSYSSGQLNLVVGKTDSLANLFWITTYGGTGSDIGYEIIPEKDNGFLVIGTTYYTNSDDFYLLHVNDSGKVVGIKNFLERKNLVDVFPNPSSGKLTIRLPHAATVNAAIEVISVEGKCVFKKQNMDVRESEFSIDFTNKLLSGFYFIKVFYAQQNYFAKICVTN